MPEAISYTEELQTMLDRTIARGNPNAQDIKSLCSVIFRMNERIKALEERLEALEAEYKKHLDQF